MRLFSTNPILFRIIYLNGDVYETAWSISSVLGQAFHKAVEVYHGGSDEHIALNQSEAVQYGLEEGMKFLDAYEEGFINFTSTIPTRQSAREKLAFAYNQYVARYDYKVKGDLLYIEDSIQEFIDIEWKGKRLNLPVPLNGKPDLVVEGKDKKIRIIDQKTSYRFSDPEAIDGAKMIQAVIYYLLVYADTGKAPYSMTFREVKYTENKSGGEQIQEYEMVYEEHELLFDFFFRLYEDMTRALNGEMVYVPNIQDYAMNNEVALIAYINRLDVPEDQAKLMKKHRVDNITDLLKRRMHYAGNMRKLMKNLEKTLSESKSINYKDMNTQDKIKTKLLEHGIILNFDSMVEGASVDLYRYSPSIGLKMSRLDKYTADIEQVLGKSGIRVLAPIPNTTLVGFEVPRENRTFPSLPGGKGFEWHIGLNIMGEKEKFDIREAPHLLVAGASGSGKSVFLSTLIEQANRLTKKESEIHLYDPKMVELALFENYKNVVEYQSEIVPIYESLSRLVVEMNDRYKTLVKAGVRSIAEYSGDMTYKFVFIDEFGDLIMQNYVHEKTILTGEMFTRGENKGQEKVRIEKTHVSKEIEKSIILLSQKARAAGIHLIVSTQRPSSDVITGTIKANFPVKAAFRTAKAVDSVVILGSSGAEKLQGKGDMIFSSPEGEVRVQGYNDK